MDDDEIWIVDESAKKEHQMTKAWIMDDDEKFGKLVISKRGASNEKKFGSWMMMKNLGFG